MGDLLVIKIFIKHGSPENHPLLIITSMMFRIFPFKLACSWMISHGVLAMISGISTSRAQRTGESHGTITYHLGVRMRSPPTTS